jgi:hypothetical protein
MSDVVNTAVLSSKSLNLKYKNKALISAIEVVVLPNSQSLDSIFSDSMHLSIVTRGDLVQTIKDDSNIKSTVLIAKRLSSDSMNQVLN